MKKAYGYKSLTFILCALAFSFLIGATFVLNAFAAGYPKRPIAIVVGSSPGGGFDLQGRLFAKYWPKYLPNKVAMIVKNVTGGGGIVAANQVWASPPDGYTIKQIKVGPYLLSQILYPSQVRYDMKKWEYIGRYTYDINAILTRTEIAEKKIKSYNDLVNYAKDKPLVVAAGGVGSSMHNKGLIFSEASGIPMRFIQFPGATQAIASMLRGESDFAFISASTASKQDPVDIRTLFIFTELKHKTTDFAPKALAFGVPRNILKKTTDNPAFSAPRALAVPPKTPAKVVSILRKSFWKLVNSKEFNRAFDKAGHFLDVQNAQEFEKELPKMTAEMKKFAPKLKKYIK